MSPTLRPLYWVAALAVSGLACLVTARPASTQTAPPPQQEVAVLRVDWNDRELVRFKASAAQPLAAADAQKIAGLQLPVLAFVKTPQLVRNALGPNAAPTRPRKFITDPGALVWYTIIDTYGDISITVDADLRVNHAKDADFRIHKRPAALNGGAHGGTTKISVFDAAADEGMEGVMVEYTVHKFPNIPYTVNIECRGKAKAICKDVATVAKDQALLQVIAAR